MWDFWTPGPRETLSRFFAFGPRDSFSQADGTSTLAAQCGALGVNVAATSPCSAIRFRKEVSRDTSATSSATPPLQFYFCSSLQSTPNTIATWGGKTGATQSFGGCSSTFLRHLYNCGNLPRHCVHDIV